jgi:dolichol-phosphate mannosyltransferase
VRTLVVLPTYQEATNIVTVLQRIRASVPSTDILVVDDNSPDGTADLAETAGRELGNIEVLRRPGKAGLGSAYRAGFDHGLAAGMDVLVEMDADLSHDPSDLPRLLRPVLQGTADLAIGSRYVAGGSIPEWPIHRRALSRWGNRYAAAMLRLDVGDVTAGFRAYRADVLRKINLETVSTDGYGFQIDMTYRVAAIDGRIVEIPIHFSDRVRGKSKMSSRIIIEALASVTWWGVRDRLKRR